MCTGRWTAYKHSRLAIVLALVSGCAVAGTATSCPKVDPARGVYPSGLYGHGVVAFEPSTHPDNPLDAVLYKGGKACEKNQFATYSFEGAPPTIESVFSYALHGEPRLFVIVSWELHHRGLNTYGKLYQVFAYGKDGKGGLAADKTVAARNDMTGIEGTFERKPSHFHGRTPAGVKELIDAGR